MECAAVVQAKIECLGRLVTAGRPADVNFLFADDRDERGLSFALFVLHEVDE